MFTRRAIGFLLAAIFLFFLASATNVGWVRVVDSVLWGMLGLSLLLQWLSVSAVGARRRLLSIEHSEGAVAPMEDGAVEVEIQLSNPWFWPRFFVSVSYDAPLESPGSRLQRFFVANLKGHGTVSISSRLRCYRRGLHQLGPVTIESQAPFGLFRRRRVVEAPLSVLVYPRPHPMTRMALLEGSSGESDLPRSARTGQEIIGSRPYYPGDSLRQIHWRNTARLGKLATKEVEDRAEKALTVLVNVPEDLGEDRETTLEYAVKLAASVGLHALSSGEMIRLLAGNLYGEWTDAEPFLKELALLTPTLSPPLASQLQKIPRNSAVLAIVMVTDADSLSTLAEAAHGPAGFTTVLLGGFTDRDYPDGPAAMLQSQGVATVACRPGGLEEAVAGLERIGSIPVLETQLQSPLP